jgi:hypothetical protein
MVIRSGHSIWIGGALDFVFIFPLSVAYREETREVQRHMLLLVRAIIHQNHLTFAYRYNAASFLSPYCVCMFSFLVFMN